MEEVSVLKIRIKFRKYGAMKFIGHLDVMRFFQKAIRRADIDIRYSEGFSPHPVMSFAAPLGVGMESMGEYLDIEVLSMTSEEEMKNALNRAMTEGISVLSVTVLPDTAKNAMASVAAARYQLAYHEETGKCAGNAGEESLCRFPIDHMEEKLAAFYAKERIPVTKKTKKGERELNLKPGIFELKTEEVSHPFENDGKRYQVISMLVDASSSGNIKPALVFDAFCQECEASLPPYSCQITRIDTFTNLAGEGETPVFVPLSAQR